MTISATYSPEDNKLRLYSSTRLDAETYERVKAAGFRWAPKQGLFVAPKWTPAREDLALELAGDIEAEEMTLAERATAKAERLDALAHKRHGEAQQMHRQADELSQAFHMGQPILVGHHSERKARKTQERMHGARDKARKAESAANYWLYRAEGVEHFANMKNCARTRANRIKTLLAELRDLQRGINDAHAGLAIWDKVPADRPDLIKEVFNRFRENVTGGEWMAWSKIDRGELDPAQARADAIATCKLRTEGPTRRRWIDHTLNRLAFERSMQGDVPRYAGDLSPVVLQLFARTHGAEKPKAAETAPGTFELSSPFPLPLHLANGNSLTLTGDDWRDLMQAVGYIVPAPAARRPSRKPKPAPLAALSAEQAEQLQRIWNTHTRQACTAYQQAKPNTAQAMTQARFSALAKGEYGPCKTLEIDANGRRVTNLWRGGEYVRSGEPVARVRAYTGGGEFYKPPAVVTITDKPTKPLPIDLDAIERALTGEAQQMEMV